MNSPLQSIGAELHELIMFVGAALQAGGAGQELAAIIAKDVEETINNLPKTFEERFYFDAAMIKALTEEWNQGVVKLSNMIIPRPGKSWGHSTLMMPVKQRNESVHFVHLILFPGDDNLDDINLLSYPFLCHELGHNLLFRNDSVFRQAFETGLNKYLSNLRLSGFADRGTAQSRASKIIEDIQTVWTPTSNHKNWAHELAIDIIALWVCGPAYLAAFQDVVEDPKINPYQIDQNHPPYEVRGLALADASELLKWGNHTNGFKQIIRDWRRSNWKPMRDNRYIALADLQLMRLCVASALATCKALSLPLCTEEQINRIREDIRKKEIPNFGTDIILAAWLIQQDYSEEDFNRWESSTVHELLKFITQ